MEPNDLLCSRNARTQNVLVRRAHSRIDQAAPLKSENNELRGMICRLARRLQSAQHWRPAYRETNLAYPETGEHLILHFQEIEATFHREATRYVEAA